jgi:hypothetical protein
MRSCGRGARARGANAHAPDEYFLIESKNAKLKGMDEMVRSFVDYLYALA